MTQLFEATGTIEQIDAAMIDVSQFGDQPESRHLPGELRIEVRTGAGTIRVPWKLSRQPVIGERVTIRVDAA